MARTCLRSKRTVDYWNEEAAPPTQSPANEAAAPPPPVNEAVAPIQAKATKKKR